MTTNELLKKQDILIKEFGIEIPFLSFASMDDEEIDFLIEELGYRKEHNLELNVNEILKEYQDWYENEYGFRPY